jgi:uncharacterized membrane protein YeaQ/YmgE (transglycosylase-associated protein family)
MLGVIRGPKLRSNLALPGLRNYVRTALTTFNAQGGEAMGILSWAIFGLIAGAIAKKIMPGLGSVTGFNIGSFLIAVGGALILLWGYRKMKSA